MGNFIKEGKKIKFSSFEESPVSGGCIPRDAGWLCQERGHSQLPRDGSGDWQGLFLKKNKPEIPHLHQEETKKCHH